MNRNLTIALLAALMGGQVVKADPPVVERAVGGGVAAPNAVTRPAPDAMVAPAPAPAPRAVNPAAELLLMLDQLQEEVRFLRGRVEEQENQLRRMREDGRDRYRDLDRRLSLINEQLSEQATARPIAPALAAPVASVAPAAVAVAPPTAAMGTNSATAINYGNEDADAYKNAFALVRQRAFPEALAAFDAFQQRYPNSPLVPNVLYWTGEVYRAKAQPDHGGAQRAYSDMLARFPQHPKAAEAYYKLGLTYESLGDVEKARQMMQTVVDRYAGQASAKLAREYLGRN